MQERYRLRPQLASHLSGMTGLRQLFKATVRVAATAGSEELERKCDVFETELGCAIELQKAPKHPVASWESSVQFHTLPHGFLEVICAIPHSPSWLPGSHLCDSTLFLMASWY